MIFFFSICSNFWIIVSVIMVCVHGRGWLRWLFFVKKNVEYYSKLLWAVLMFWSKLWFFSSMFQFLDQMSLWLWRMFTVEIGWDDYFSLQSMLSIILNFFGQFLCLDQNCDSFLYIPIFGLLSFLWLWCMFMVEIGWDDYFSLKSMLSIILNFFVQFWKSGDEKCEKIIEEYWKSGDNGEKIMDGYIIFGLEPLI